MMETVSPKCLQQFTKLWSKYDPKASYFINLGDLPDFVSQLTRPLGVLTEDEVAGSNSGSSGDGGKGLEVSRKLKRIELRVFKDDKV